MWRYLCGLVTWLINPPSHSTVYFWFPVKKQQMMSHTRRESLSQPQNIMYDKRVVRGSNYSHMHMQPVSSDTSLFNEYLQLFSNLANIHTHTHTPTDRYTDKQSIQYTHIYTYTTFFALFSLYFDISIHWFQFVANW